MTVSTRAQVITRRTYSRPKNAAGDEFETWQETVDRVITHQKWLWERAKTQNILPEMPLHDISSDLQEWVSLEPHELQELEELRDILSQHRPRAGGGNRQVGQ